MLSTSYMLELLVLAAMESTVQDFCGRGFLFLGRCNILNVVVCAKGSSENETRTFITECQSTPLGFFRTKRESQTLLSFIYTSLYYSDWCMASRLFNTSWGQNTHCETA